MIRFDKKIKTKNLKENEVLFDIETNGISRYKNSILLIGYINGKTDVFTQLFSDYGEDLELLETFKAETKNFSYVTYNGRTFDFPFINTRLKKHGKEELFIDKEYDLFYDVRVNKKILGIKHHKLTYLEDFYGIERNESINKNKLSKEYISFLEKTDNYKELLLHNKEDVINTEKLLFLRDRIKEERSFSIEKIHAYISSIEFDKDFLNIQVRAKSPLNMELYYSDKNQSIKWLDDSLNLHIRIVNAKNKNKDIKLYLSTIGNIEDKSPLKLKNNLVLLDIDNSYQMENIKNLILLILKHFIQQ